jgi:hypothetical protein
LPVTIESCSVIEGAATPYSPLALTSVSTVIDGVPLTLSDGFPVSVSRPL